MDEVVNIIVLATASSVVVYVGYMVKEYLFSFGSRDDLLQSKRVRRTHNFKSSSNDELSSSDFDSQD